MPILSDLESVTIDSMGHLNHLSSKRNPTRQWRLLDLVSAFFFSSVLLFFLLLFRPLGDSLEASGRQALLRSTANLRRRHRLVELMEACRANAADHMPCEDPRCNSQFSRNKIS